LLRGAMLELMRVYRLQHRQATFPLVIFIHIEPASLPHITMKPEVMSVSSTPHFSATACTSTFIGTAIIRHIPVLAVVVTHNTPTNMSISVRKLDQ